MKKLLVILLSCALVLSLFSFGDFIVSAEKDGCFTYSVYNDEVTITKCDTIAAGNITIPSVINGYTVTEIYGNVFSNCNSITDIVIPQTVAKISVYAFENCDSLQKIEVDINNLHYTSDGNCLIETATNKIIKGLNNTTIPDYVEIIGVSAFKNCDFETINIPDGVKYIYRNAFFNCSKLNSITVPSSVIKIGSSAFEGCVLLSDICVAPSTAFAGEKCLYNTAFYNNAENWESGVLYLNSHIVASNNTVSGVYTVKDGTTHIAAFAFAGRSKITDVKLPDSLIYIGESAFKNCVELESVDIPNNVSVIMTSAFAGCTNLANITIPEKNIKIGSNVFWGTAYYRNADNWEDEALYVGKHLVETKPSIEGVYEVKPETVTIADGVFMAKELLEDVIIPESVVSVGEKAFMFCYSLKEIIVPQSVTEIAYQTFKGCFSLESISVSEKLKSIDVGAFDNCAALEDVLYTGTEEERENISINEMNEDILTAQWQYNTNLYEIGDINGDRKTNVSDIAVLKKVIAGIISVDSVGVVQPDINKSGGEPNVADLAILKKIIAGI